MKYEKEELEKLIKEEKMSYEAIGRIYGVTGNAIKKAAVKLGIELERKRKINPNENFSHTGNTKFNKFSDEEFVKIINNSVGWKEICEGFGYSSIVGSYTKDQILERCKSLNITPNLIRNSPILGKTKGELLSDRKNYQSYRSSVRQWAERIYKKENPEGKCAVCGYDKHIEVAHIKAVSDFDNNATLAEINDIHNLIGLCPNHHWEFDNGILDISPYIHRGMEEESISPVS